MPIGAFTGSFDLPLLLVIVFTLFFGALVFYLRQEDKREGYPLVSGRTDRSGGRVPVVGFPPLPTPKTFVLPHGRGTKTVPEANDPSPVPDAPFQGNGQGMPIDDGTPRLGQSIGPGSWVLREDEPELSHDNRPVFRPMRYATGFKIMKGEPDPRGWPVYGCDGALAGTVSDVWIDESEHFAKFLEIDLADDWHAGRWSSALPEREQKVVGAVVTDTVVATDRVVVETIRVDPVTAPVGRASDDPDERAAPTHSIMLPIEFAAVNGRTRTVRTGAITGAQFAGVPGRRRDLVITSREENRLRGYYGGGYLWATPSRAEPLL